MRRLALILLPCAVAVLLHFWFARRPSSALVDNNTLSDEPLPFYEVLVGVLSARHHYQLRQAIRKTWQGNIRGHPHLQHRVGVKFVVGKYGCPIPEEDREDPYSCFLLNFTQPVMERDVEMEIVTVSDPSTLAPSDVSSIALDFKVLHPVVITRLGMFSSRNQPELQSNVTVKLFQLEQEEAVVTARFSSINMGTLVNWVWYKPVEQFILPKGFEGSLIWESLDSAVLTTINSSSVELNNGGGVLKFSSIAEGILPHRSARGFPGLAGGFTFTIYDGEGLSELLKGRPARMEHHASRLRQEDSSLQEENLRHDDMVFVDVVDTYRNVPTKLLQFYKWSVGNTDFNLLLKTDDDCYIDVDSVLMKIDHKGLKRRNFWWGNFRQSWAVDRIGKWQELEYASPAYPAFACGSGYVVSHDVVQWLASNSEKLKAYQGEDVSMGIWMAAVGPQKYQDSGWLCEKECYVDMLSSPQHTAQELHTLWDRRRRCGDACECPENL
ncbi:UDP-GalNAc:beta-1,3-N-acetylgalactosaminyltransferase 2 [Gouania willdenowi]|uniref:Hexosyltransferase n=1 Tax=Gouania willdenowi TaxID=441366 RepID=A0A8C5GDQ1_GOUWI|nr:UDP-GalNAc:beta-1,3-N-acetylgalactosaminyltransferase 2 [Gouania willdenowi]